MNYTKTWQEIYEKLTKSLPDHAIRTWFEPINSIALVENEIVLEVPNQFFFEWIESVSYTHLPSPRDQRGSRMPSSA